MCLSVLPSYMSVHHVYTWCSRRPEEGIGSLGTGVTDGWEPPRGHWEVNLHRLEEQPVIALNRRTISPAPWNRRSKTRPRCCHSPFVLSLVRMVLNVPWSPVESGWQGRELAGGLWGDQGSVLWYALQSLEGFLCPKGKGKEGGAKEKPSVLETWVHIWVKYWLCAPQDSPGT